MHICVYISDGLVTELIATNLFGLKQRTFIICQFLWVGSLAQSSWALCTGSAKAAVKGLAGLCSCLETYLGRTCFWLPQMFGRIHCTTVLRLRALTSFWMSAEGCPQLLASPASHIKTLFSKASLGEREPLVRVHYEGELSCNVS